MSTGANARHFTGLLLAVVGSFIGLLGLGFIVLGVEKRESAAVACGAVGLLVGGFLTWRGIKMRNRAAKESTMFKDEENTWVSVTGKQKAPYRKDPPPGDDW